MSRHKSIIFKTQSGTSIQIRSPEVGEGAVILRLVTEILAANRFGSTEPDEMDPSPQKEDEWIADHLERPDQMILIAYHEEIPIGLLNFSTPKKRRLSHIGTIGISMLAQYRGQGIGQRMLELMIEWAKANPTIEKVHLKVHAQNIGAQNLYKRLGFQEEGRELQGIKFAPNDYDDVISMSKFVK